MMQKGRGKLIYFLRFSVGIVIIVLLFKMVDIEDLPRLSQLNFGFIAAASLLVVLDRFLNAYRWSILIYSKELRVDLSEIVKIYFKSIFLGLVLPSSIGGEFLKGYGLLKATSKGIDSFSSVFAERILGHIALISICTASFFFFVDVSECVPEVLVIRNLSIAILVSTFLILSVGYWFFSLSSRSTWEEKGRILLLIQRALVSFFEFGKDKGKLVLAFAVSFLIQFVRILLTWLLGLSLGIKADFSSYLVFVPLAQFGGMIPLSIAGLGIEEGALVYFFSLVGATSARILSMGILSRILNICSVLPGGWLFLREGIGLKAKRNDQKGISPEVST